MTTRMKLVDGHPKEASTALLNPGNMVPLLLVNMVPPPLVNMGLPNLVNMVLQVANPAIPHNKIMVNNPRNKDMGTDSLASRATEQNLVIPSNKATDKHNSQDTDSSLSNLVMDRSLASLAIPRNKEVTTNQRLGTTRASSAYLQIAFPREFTSSW